MLRIYFLSAKKMQPEECQAGYILEYKNEVTRS
jgi:hypothetical protein